MAREQVELFIVQRKRRREKWNWNIVVNALGNPLVKTLREAQQIKNACMDAEHCEIRILQFVAEVVE